MSSVLTKPNSTQKLATFLYSFINNQFEKEIAVSNGELTQDTIVIRTVRNYDAVNVPLSEFPLLKVYKNRDVFKKGTTFRTSQGAITYAVSYPQLDVMPNLLDWMSYQLNLGLLTYQMSVNDLEPPPNQEGYSSEFLLTLNEQNQTVAPFLRFNINFKNFCDNQNYQQ